MKGVESNNRDNMNPRNHIRKSNITMRQKEKSK